MTDADGVANLSVVVRFVSLGVVRRKAESYADWTFVNFNEVEFNHGNLISVGWGRRGKKRNESGEWE